MQDPIRPGNVALFFLFNINAATQFMSNQNAQCFFLNLCTFKKIMRTSSPMALSLTYKRVQVRCLFKSKVKMQFKTNQIGFAFFSKIHQDDTSETNILCILAGSNFKSIQVPRKTGPSCTQTQYCTKYRDQTTTYKQSNNKHPHPEIHDHHGQADMIFVMTADHYPYCTENRFLCRPSRFSLHLSYPNYYYIV